MIVQVAGAAGAVYFPAPVIVPQELDQFTATLAVNCCVELIWSVTAEGFNATRMQLTLAVEVEPDPSAAVAVTVQRSAVAGQVNSPTELTPPPPDAGQFLAHVTVVPFEVETKNC